MRYIEAIVEIIAVQRKIIIKRGKICLIQSKYETVITSQVVK